MPDAVVHCIDVLISLLCVQTVAEDLINGLEEYIAESFVRSAPVTHTALNHMSTMCYI